AGLLAAACDDLTVRIYDTTARRLVRRLRGHTGAIADLCFTADGRRLATAAADRSLRVWDLPTGRCVDWLSFRSAPAAVATSPTGEFLVTAHVGRVGLSVWADRSFFQPVFLDAEPTAPALMDDPAPLSEAPSAAAAEAAAADEAAAEAAAAVAVVRGEPEGDRPAIRGARAAAVVAGDRKHDMAIVDDPTVADGSSGKDGGLITLSTLPRAYWANLFNLELVKARNRPVAPPKKPQSAPFFLPTMHRGVEPVFAAPSEPEEKSNDVSADAEAGKVAAAAKEKEDQETAAAELAAWGGAWSDDDDGTAGGDDD
ncbi:unnamed protein product, partial [Phaeothamnion confervicola]